jgi:type VI secretion system secreted protein Hcp
MEQVMVTSISTGGSGGEDRLTENVSLNFATVNFENFKQDAKGATTSAGIFKWKIAENVAG